MSNKVHAALWSTALALAVVVAAPGAKADEWNKETHFTFNKPVEVPGYVLGPGEYVFKLLDSPSNRDIVEIYNATQQRLVTTVLAIPDYRLRTPDKPVITFEERSHDSPEAVHTWFYPGDNYGWEFVYHRPATTMLASAAPLPSANPSTGNMMPPAEPQPRAALTQPLQPRASAAAQPPAEIASAQVPVEAQQTPPTTLPKTAGALFPLLLAGITLVGSGASLSRCARRG